MRIGKEKKAGELERALPTRTCLEEYDYFGVTHLKEPVALRGVSFPMPNELSFKL